MNLSLPEAAWISLGCLSVATPQLLWSLDAALQDHILNCVGKIPIGGNCGCDYLL